MAYYSQGGYTHQNPAYGGTAEKYRPDTAVAVGGTVVRDSPRWSWCSTGWAVFATLFCTSCCSFLGLLCSIWSYVDHKSGDYDRARYKRRCSWGCTCFGIFLGLAVIAAIIVLLFVFDDELCEHWDDKPQWYIDWKC